MINHTLSLTETSLITPQQLIKQHPVSQLVTENVTASRITIRNILARRDPRLLVIIGPCSIHDTQAALDYATRLNKLRLQHQDRLFIVMRSYFEKPRSVVGWKGLIADPHLDGSFDINNGLAQARKILLDINQLGLATATEFLDPITGQYIADLISWGAIGARTTESQIHREMASSLRCPIGFKNGTDGNIRIAVDAIRAAQASHLFLSTNASGKTVAYRTPGNTDCHIIMRGGKTPNYHAQDIAQACHELREHQLPQRIIVDCSHGNCQKQHRRQLDVATNICQQLVAGSRYIAGVMIESFLQAGNQREGRLEKLEYGQSITDPCLGWNDSRQVIEQLAAAVNIR
jgi:3-deoxy-7-phosphoheptulonate synthase